MHMEATSHPLGSRAAASSLNNMALKGFLPPTLEPGPRQSWGPCSCTRPDLLHLRDCSYLSQNALAVSLVEMVMKSQLQVVLQLLYFPFLLQPWPV